MILRSKSAIEGHLAGSSTDGPTIGTTRKRVILGASITPLRLLPRPWIFFLKGTVAATTRVMIATIAENHTQIQRKNLDEAKQNHDGDEEERVRNSTCTQSHDEIIHHDLHRRACHRNAASGSVIHLYIHSSSSKRRNNTLKDTMPRPRIFGAELVRWTDLACVYLIPRFSRTH